MYKKEIVVVHNRKVYILRVNPSGIIYQKGSPNDHVGIINDENQVEIDASLLTDWCSSAETYIL